MALTELPFDLDVRRDPIGSCLESPRRADAFSLLPLSIGGLVITAAALARRRHLPLRGAAIAFVATLVLGAVGFVTMLGGLGWR